MEVRVLSKDIEKALRNLKKKLQVDGILGELKKRRHYEKPSVKKKKKQEEAQKRRQKLLKRAKPSGSGSGARTGKPYSQSPSSAGSQGPSGTKRTT